MLLIMITTRRSSVVHRTARLLDHYLAALQICAVCLTCRPKNLCDHHSLTSSMSASRSAQQLETDRSLWLVLDYGTVCHQIFFACDNATYMCCHGSVKNSIHFSLNSHIVLVFLCGPCGFYRSMHFSAKRGLAIACRLSVYPSVCVVGGL